MWENNKNRGRVSFESLKREKGLEKKEGEEKTKTKRGEGHVNVIRLIKI